MKKTLHQIGSKYGTDKSDIIHSYNGISYLDIYDKHFNDIRDYVEVVVEIGVLNGKSLLMWKEYFPNAIIYGIDIDPSCKQYEDERIKIFIGDQNDEAFLNKVKQDIGEYDILIDDGSHINKHQILTFNILYENLSKGGYYVIEDLRMSYGEVVNGIDLRSSWPGMMYNKPDDPLKNNREDFNVFLQSKIKELDFHMNTTNLIAIHNYPMIAIFENLKN